MSPHQVFNSLQVSKSLATLHDFAQTYGLNYDFSWVDGPQAFEVRLWGMGQGEDWRIKSVTVDNLRQAVARMLGDAYDSFPVKGTKGVYWHEVDTNLEDKAQIEKEIKDSNICWCGVEHPNGHNYKHERPV